MTYKLVSANGKNSTADKAPVSAQILQETFAKVEQAKQEWEATMDALPQIVCLVDRQAGILRANRAVERWQLGLVTEVKERNLHTLLHPGCADSDCMLLRFIIHALTHLSTNELEIADSYLQRYVQVKIKPVDARSRMRSRTSAVIINDITQLKATEESLRQSNRALQGALRAKQEMLQNVSHELRTPLALIHGYVHLLKDNVLGPLTVDQKEAIDVLQERTQYLKGMIEQLLLVQSLTVEQVHRAPCDLVSLAETAISQAQPNALKRRIRLEWVPPSVTEVELMVDGSMVLQALGNLLDNAIKFSYEDSQVSIQMTVTPQEVVFAVTDRGIGVLSQEKEMIFDEFHQGNGSLTRVFGGMGMGLAVCRKIADAHEGRLWVESGGQGCGSTFYLALPRASGIYDGSASGGARWANHG